ncbi:YhgE/Pip domain-containing protein [Levilactobacillus brevis]|uniref:YhgE/Pip domain-containing protein n=1 Tax=Levilactobacillus brevis TaxID=1580 RepID=UPI000419DE36|nr:ABC transporter permease [Levilactobacillus brevis]
MLNVFKRKNIWISMLVAAILIGLFAFAQVGARSTVKVRHLPLALVVNDNGKDAKNVVNKLRKESHEKNSEIKWVNVNHTNELTKGFASGKYYGAVVIHSGFTKAINQQQTI